jgi:predicted Fe-Mo cluster-binding NifX family protein
MKIAVAHSKENDLVPLDLAEVISIVDTEEKKISQYQNPGFERMPGGKEITMAAILKLQPDAVVVKEGMMCPGSYRMSVGRIKYAHFEEGNLDDILPKLDKVNEVLSDDIPPEVYREIE